jgi:hypothetical protein
MFHLRRTVPLSREHLREQLFLEKHLGTNFMKTAVEIISGRVSFLKYHRSSDILQDPLCSDEIKR